VSDAKNMDKKRIYSQIKMLFAKNRPTVVTSYYTVVSGLRKKLAPECSTSITIKNIIQGTCTIKVQ